MKVLKIFSVLIFMLGVAYAQTSQVSMDNARLVPKLLNYQGYLTDTTDVPIDGALDMTFKIFDAASSGNELWSEAQTNVPVERGVFSVILGSGTTIPDSVFADFTSTWLELTLEGPQILTPRTRITSVGYAYTSTYSDTAEYANNAVADNDWTLSSSRLYPSGDYGLSMRSSNVMWGSYANTHVAFGVACTSGTASDPLCGYCAVAGGRYNAATSDYASVGGGRENNASNYYATVSGGKENIASGHIATVCGGEANTATNDGAVVSGGNNNHATAIYSTVTGGQSNLASGTGAVVVGGDSDTSAAYASFTTNSWSIVPSSYSSSAAFNGATATASTQTRVGLLSKAAGSFTIDHPLDPENKILNHYFVESPEMVLIYRGIARIGSDGTAIIHLPDYFDALNKNPMVQLTGVGTSEPPYLMENVRGNRFVIAGKPDTEVHWIVTGERKDMSADIARIFMPVEQSKEGPLAGRSLDDALLVSAMAQLEHMGYASKFNFRTAAARQRYEEMKRRMERQ